MNPIVIAEALNKTVKIRAVKTTELIETARVKHDISYFSGCIRKSHERCGYYG